MPLPIAAAGLVGGIVAGLTQFFASRIAVALTAAGLTIITVKGLETVIGFVISDVQAVAALLNAQGSGVAGGSALGAAVIQLLAYIGFFDCLNILIAGYLAAASLQALKVFLARLTS